MMRTPRRAEARRALRRVARGTSNVIDAALTAVYLVLYAYALKNSGYTLDAVTAITAIHAILVALGWRNPPLRVSPNICILYRTGFLPLYASIFVLLSALYNNAVNEVVAAYSLTAFILVLAVLKLVRQDPARYIFASSIAAGLLLGATRLVEATAFSFSLPPLATAIARPRTLCDDRPLLYVASIYSMAATVILLTALGVKL